MIMNKNILKTICLICVFGYSVLSFAADVTCSGSITSALQSAVNAASDGDTININGSSCSAGAITIPSSKGVTIVGDGIGSTTISGASFNITVGAGNSVTSIGGFTLSSSGLQFSITGTVINQASWRIHHINFTNPNTSSYTILVGSGDANAENYSYGLIDNCIFAAGYYTAIFIQHNRNASNDPATMGDWVWTNLTQSDNIQNSKAVYVEDNTFNATGGNEQAIDCRWGVRYVFRNNTLNNAWISTHSGQTNGGRDPMWVEIYDNVMTSNASRYFRAVEMRSVSGVVYGNDFGDDYAVFVGLDHERSCGTSTSGPYNPQCNGARSWDENSGGSGWRCLGQPGWGPPQENDMSAYSFVGFSEWNNEYCSSPPCSGGTDVDIEPQNSCAGQNANMVSGRDYFNDVSMGVAASRPGTCDAGPAGRDLYWATDSEILYYCSTTNNWSSLYQPYTYPHPLRGEETPVPANEIQGIQI